MDGQQRARLDRWLPWLVGALPVLVLWPLLRGELPYGFDTIRFFLPLVTHANRMVHTGELPLWTADIGAGFPLWASLQVPMWYPPAWPLYLVEDVPLALGWYLVGHLCLACAGGVVLARRAGLSRQAAVLVGVACGASLPMAALATRPEFACAGAWCPWTLAAVLERVRARAAARFGVTLGLGACVSPQLAGAHLVTALLLLAVWRGGKASWRFLPAGMLYLGAVCLPAVVPLVDFLPWSDRTAGGWWNPHANALDPSQLLQWFSPGVLGSLPLGWDALWDLDPTRMRMNHSTWMPALLPGVVVSLLAVHAAVCSRRARWLMAFVMVCLVMGLSVVPGVTTLWTIPPLSVVRYYAKAWHVAVPILALLGGVGLDLLLRRRRMVVPLGVLGVGLHVATALLASPIRGALADVSLREETPATLDAHLLPSLALSAVTLVVALLLLRLPRARTAWLVLAAAECVAYASTIPMVPAPTLPDTVQHRRVLVAVDPDAPGVYAPPWWDAAERTRVDRQRGDANLPLLDGAGLAISATGIRLGNWRRLETALSKAPERFCSAADCDELVLPAAAAAPAGMRPQHTNIPLGITRYVPDPPGDKVHCAQSLVVVAPQAWNQALQDPALALGTHALLAGPVEVPGGACTRATITARTSQRVELAVDAPQPTLVWTADVLGPGWSVTVNGVLRDPVAVHGALRGVAVDAGHSVVIWDHSAQPQLLGLLGSAVCMLLLLRRRR